MTDWVFRGLIIVAMLAYLARFLPVAHMLFSVSVIRLGYVSRNDDLKQLAMQGGVVLVLALASYAGGVGVVATYLVLIGIAPFVVALVRRWMSSKTAEH